ncbi:L-tyrosine:2-oxoglutarate aminotransferase [Obba rivulosa]|uniref:L-tyrosine:2-oxoglutarate aminotransferase n=1 Tax=Obba rivulosa TaxID=1052685 RepID=A0A8E2DG98_9APHY|nr:L-tyrosine:2-oxoglutarate aminotransferase [Obba rivulosa]
MSGTNPFDLSRHLSSEAKARVANPMKAIWKLIQQQPNVVMLANGDPHFSLYPIRKVDFEVASIENQDPVKSWTASRLSARTLLLTSSSSNRSALPLNLGLQYANGAGRPEAQRAAAALTQFYHAPPDHITTLTLGNFDGITKCLRLLGEPGDKFLADEFAFRAVTNAGVPQGIEWISVKMDGCGMIPESLEEILVRWDEGRGKRPHVLYVVPCGQNPTGSTLSLERRRKIYEIAQLYDLVIIEDDPYYFLQYPSDPNDSSLVPSFLSLDTDGRVIRLDSLSKILAPGLRLGWLTSSAAFHEHLIALTDSSTQHPHGFGQVFLAELLSEHGWGLAGFDRWVSSLREEYRRRRDFFLEEFERRIGGSGLVNARAPEAGMFVWIRVNIEKHPRYQNGINAGDGAAARARTNVAQLMQELFMCCLDSGLVIVPASVFALSGDSVWDDSAVPIEDRVYFLRATFAGTEEIMRKGLEILANVLQTFFAE